MNEQYELIPSDALTNHFDKLPKEVKKQWLAIQSQKMIEDTLAELQQSNEALKREMQQMKAEDDFRHEVLSEGLREVADASAKRFKSSDKYFVKTVLGLNFVPEISGQRMTKLLRVVGIIGLNNTPFSQFRGGHEPLAKVKPNTEYPTWLFHSEKVTTKIDKWLEEHDYYMDFYNTATKEERDTFIDMLYDEYVD